ncbi:MAG TPA: DoxX family membrane protein [Dehalococcoidia bacterium]|nr:DoxX family membrane protein [Dehalococcoidia bacterium]
MTTWRRRLSSLSQAMGNRYLILGLRLLLGGVFLLSAAGKLPKQAEFVDAVTGYGVLPQGLASAYGSVLPWLELAVGLGLVLGLLPRVCAGASLLMIISFIVANGTYVWREYPLDAPCPCFGDLLTIRVQDALVMDVVIMVVASLLLLSGSRFLTLDSWAWGRIRGWGHHAR